MDVNAYLNRIGFSGGVDPTPATLRQLHKAHMIAVPFENLDIHLKRPIILEQDALFDKIVRHRRGGFCYELNGLFGTLLRALGFSVSMLSAGVAREQGGFGPEFDHMALRVELEQNWLADVGFGDGFLEPLALDSQHEQVQANGFYRIDRSGGWAILMRRSAVGPWTAQYRFKLDAHTMSEYWEMCTYHQTSPLSSFTRKRLATRATPDGRITLSGMRLIVTASDGRRTERELTDEGEYSRVLADSFGMQIETASA